MAEKNLGQILAEENHGYHIRATGRRRPHPWKKYLCPGSELPMIATGGGEPSSLPLDEGAA